MDIKNITKMIKYLTVAGEHTYLSYNKSIVCTTAYISALAKYIQS